MKNFHVICGLPRSGSTLLCNILNQNPRFHASSTSCLSQSIGTLSMGFSQSPEIKSELHNDRDLTESRILNSLMGLIDGWYYHKKDKVVFDKGRGWGHNSATLKSLFPKGKLIVCVRDLRDVFASIEKQHSKFPVLDDASNPMEKTVYSRADRMFSPEGVIGICVGGIEDILRRRLPDTSDAVIVQYERLVSSPEPEIKMVYDSIGEEFFEHDFENVQNTSEDVDALYLNKYPHDGSGKVCPPPIQNRGRWVPPDISQQIMSKYQSFNRAFGYV